MMQLPELSLSRQEIRRVIRQRRRALTPEQQRRFGQQAAARMLSFPPVVMAHTVAVFLSFDGELDTQPLIEQLWLSGKRVYLPVLHPFSAGNLLFLHYHPHSELVTNRLKIQEPKLDVRDVLPLSQLDVLVTPLVAFDDDGQRLGMGGGFYDRTLQNWQSYGLTPVGYTHDCQRVEKLPVEEWDIPLPAVVTPSKVWTWQAHSHD
ncbi:5-formyltetrahydrofolate cyclo-ligase [Salmonella enterica]|nr:5-formyltetrahydrofolate cyclo-ligase [Salmonella enterica]EDR5596023.1 5-formyltetrahydrofolate cyclo-ligase [Salmonella enterica subsp. diarizonae]EDU6308505.1 5-formyltetrahydrofolate cyclo-ligase [Salmonella enterica subsp. diarizonae serovar 53:z10:z]EBK3631426.1 5-formyltetrahydrofolate cyclo-ligase [Salmonella enterica]EGW0489039.1 5-formyltetrahydrofolate cyclo-ligase [Salmonella enterica]